jgi:hypothetical protein
LKIDIDNINKKYLSKSPSPFSIEEIHKKYNFKAKNNNNATYLHDLSCTLYINLKDISNIKYNEIVTILSKKQMDLLKNKISLISGLFKNLRKFQKKEKNIKSQILVNNQLLEEIKRRNKEGLLILGDKKKELIKANNKKQEIIRKYKKKFNEVEIFIRRESQFYDKYKNLYNTFTMDPFIIKNTNLLNIINNKKDDNNKIRNLINIVNYENEELKYNYYSNNNHNINKREIENKSIYKVSNINKLLIIQEDKTQYFHNNIENLEKLYNDIIKYKYNKQYEEIGANRSENLTNKILNNLNKLAKISEKSIILESDKGSNNMQEIENPDSSELWSASEIEK